jgi:N-acetylmuramoyl-L-alanine amidase
LIFTADFAHARVRSSPNHGPRIGCNRPDLIILHYTGMETGQGAEDWLCVEESQVSSHYLVHENGDVVQMVREADRAWHAGRSIWQGQTDTNSRSIGIEIVNPGHGLGYPDFPEVQIASVISLCRDIATRLGIHPQQVLAHSDVAPGRKIDPGEKFPWQQLHAAGLGFWVEPSAVDADEPLSSGDGTEIVMEAQQMLGRFGYGVDPSGCFDEHTRIVIEAFQRHFRPLKVDGLLDRSTMATLRRLMKASLTA